MSDQKSKSEPLAVKLKPACVMAGCGPTKLRDDIASGRLAAKKNGKLIIIELAELKRYIAAMPPAKLTPYVRPSESARSRSTAAVKRVEPKPTKLNRNRRT